MTRANTGQTALTRNGTFQVAATGQLATAEGDILVPPIRLPRGVDPSTVTIGADGTFRRSSLDPNLTARANLSDREHFQIHRNRQADELYISQKTVKNHLASIYAKLDARDRTQAVLNAVRIGIVRLN